MSNYENAVDISPNASARKGTLKARIKSNKPIRLVAGGWSRLFDGPKLSGHEELGTFTCSAKANGRIVEQHCFARSAIQVYVQI